MKRPSPSKQTLGYVGILVVALLIAVLSGRTSVATQIDDYAYDWMFRLHPPTSFTPQCIILAIDDPTFNAMGGVAGYRRMLTKAFELLKPAEPNVVAVDMVLADQADPNEDARLSMAMQGVKNLVLVAHLSNGRWETPLPGFRASAASLGHDEADENSADGVTRQIPLEERTAAARYWSLALEAFRLERGQRIFESPEVLQIGGELIPAARSRDNNRPLRVLYTTEPVPQISLKELVDNPALAARFRGKVAFIGVTSISGSYDRVATPFGQGRIPGVAVHAQLFETLERGQFLIDASPFLVLGLCLVTGVVAGLTFALLSGIRAYLAAGGLLIVAHATPLLFFRQSIVFPYFTLLASGWLTLVAAATYQHFVARRQLRKAETDRQRYQQAIHFVTHEMRTPLTAIQGSSELMGRYALPEEKRKQIADMINQESKRLARMIQTFLDIERLSDGQMDLKREPFSAREIVETCIQRARPLAERKNILIQTSVLEGHLEGDRELMEYAVYNLLTNAIKYSEAGTEINIWCLPQGDQLRLSVKDQGIGMDAKELRQIFQKFYRTKRAEASGEAGTGIGLSIVEQIVHHHGGKIEVTSEPGKGSCFTAVLPAHSRASQAPPVSV